MTGGRFSETTEIKEIGEKQKWTVLKNGDNPVPYPLGKVAELKLTTINNVVYAFGKKH